MSRRRRNSGNNILMLLVLVLVVVFIALFYNSRSTDNPIGNVINDKGTTTTTTIPHPAKTIKIASWNMQRFGKEKADNGALMDTYVNVLGNYDIVIIQELTDSTGEAFDKLCSMMKGYKCASSDRLGNSSYKEQYGLLYRNAELLGSVKGSGAYVRVPYTFHFRSGNWSFYLTTIHTDPDNVKAELSLLDKQIGSDQSADRLIMGDLNAGCSYYKAPHSDFVSWDWVIPDSEDTTVKATYCAYDRIILNKEAVDNFISYGIYRNVTVTESDHYLINVELRTDAA